MNIKLVRMAAFICIVVFAMTVTGFARSNAIAIQSKKILIVSPHEDDECIACAGIIRKAVMDGNDVRVMFTTNGDVINLAETRIKESIAALAKLGLSKDKIYYLGYGDYNVLDGIRSTKNNPTQVFTDMCGYTETYGFPGIIDDYHYKLTGTHALYCRQNLMYDVRSILDSFRPGDIYLPSAFESHLDHKATSVFITDTILEMKKTASYSPMLHEYMIYKYGLPQSNLVFDSLPVPNENCDANMDFTSPYSWNNRESVTVPDDMHRLQTTSMKINVVNAGAKFNTDSPNSPQNDISKAFDGDTGTMYVSSGAKTETVLTVTFSSSQLVEKVRAMFGDSNSISTNVTLEAADNLADMNMKANSYRLVAQNVKFAAGNWSEIGSGEAFNCKVWRFSIHNLSTDNNVRIPEMEFYSANLKAQSLRMFPTQAAGNYDRRSMRDEIFWKKDMSNLAFSVRIPVTSGH